MRAAVIAGCVVTMCWLIYGRASMIRQDKQFDFLEFFSAAEAMTRGADIYAVGTLGYIYPPLIAWALTPLVPLGMDGASWVWLALTAGALALNAWLGAAEVCRRFNVRRDSTLLLAVALLGLILTIDKTRADLRMGQINQFVLLAWVLGLRWLDRRPMLAGAALGMAATIKYVTLLALPYMLLRRRWRAAGATAATAVGAAFLPAITLGWERNLGMLGQAFGGLMNLVKPALTDEGSAKVMGLQTGPSFSLTTIAARLTSADGGANAATFAVLAGLAAACFGASWWLYARRGTPMFLGRGGAAEASPALRGVVLLEWVGLIVVSLVFSPQTNARHLATMLLPHCAAAAVLLAPHDNTRGGRRAGLLLIAGVAAMLFLFHFPPGGGPWRDLQLTMARIGAPSWGALALWFTLLWAGLGQARWDASGQPGAPRDAGA